MDSNALRDSRGSLKNQLESLFMADAINTVCCGICSREVFLTDCKTDEHGHAVHEECYTVRVIEGQPTSSLKTEEGTALEN